MVSLKKLFFKCCYKAPSLNNFTYYPSAKAERGGVG